VKADSLEAANLAAAKELKMERDLEDALSPSPPPPPQAPAASKGKTAHVEGGGKAVKEVPFIPKHYLDVPKVPKVHPRRPGAARKAQVKQQQLVSVHKQQGQQQQQQQQGQGHQLLPGVKPDGELEGKINLEGVAVPQAANVAMFRQSQRVNRRQEIQKDGGDEQKGLLRAGGKPTMPDIPNDITNSIVQRLLKMAHSGKLKVPVDDSARVRHPITDALSEHGVENTRLESLVPSQKLKGEEQDMRAAAERAREQEQRQGRVYMPARGGYGGVEGERGDSTLPPSRVRKGDGGLLGMIEGPLDSLFGDRDARKTLVPA